MGRWVGVCVRQGREGKDKEEDLRCGCVMLLCEEGKKGRNGEEWEVFIPVGSLAFSAGLVARRCRTIRDVGGLEARKVGKVGIYI